MCVNEFENKLRGYRSRRTEKKTTNIWAKNN